MDKKILIGLIIFILIWICLGLQCTFFEEVKLFGVAPNIGVVFVAGIGLSSGVIPGVLTGGIYGLLTDILFGKTFGIYLVLYMLIGFASGGFSKGFSKENKLSMVYMVAALTAIMEIVTYLIFILIYSYSFEPVSAIIIILKETVYNMILARLLFKPISWLGEIINKSKNSYYLL